MNTRWRLFLLGLCYAAAIGGLAYGMRDIYILQEVWVVIWVPFVFLNLVAALALAPVLFLGSGFKLRTAATVMALVLLVAAYAWLVIHYEDNGWGRYWRKTVGTMIPCTALVIVGCFAGPRIRLRDIEY